MKAPRVRVRFYMHDDLPEPRRPLSPWRVPAYPPEETEAAKIPVRPVELAALLGISVLFDLTLYASPGGAGMAALLVTVPVVLGAAALQPVRSARLMAVGALLFLLAVRCLWRVGALPVGLGAVILLSFSIALRTKRTHVPELVVSVVASALGAFRHLWHFADTAWRAASPARAARFSWRTVTVPLALVGVFGVIFAAANPMVQGALQSAWSYCRTFTLYPSPLRVLFWCASALAGAALLRPIARVVWGRPTAGAEDGAPAEHALGEQASAEDASAERSGSGVSTVWLDTARNVLAALNLLFLAYNGLDAIYLWAGRLPRGVGHTEYAHRGAGWLTVAMLLATVVLGVLFRGATATDPRAKWQYRLAYGWAAQNVVLAAGTFRRIQMYVDFSGLTQLRIVGIVGTILTVVGLVLIVVKLARGKTMLWLVRAQLDALGIALVLFVASPTEGLSTQFNVSRIRTGELRPLLHFFLQPTSAEVIPALVPLLDHPDVSVRCGVASLILMEASTLRDQDSAATHWTEWQFSRKRAIRVLDQNEARIRALIPPDGDPFQALSKLRELAVSVNDEDELAWERRY